VSVDAVELIRAYEDRNARLGGQLRDSIKARLLIVASQEEEAFRLAGADDELAEKLHSSAMEELERVREAELRALGDELHPDVVRLGLPAALKALRRDLADVIAVRLDIDPRADPLGPATGQRAFDVPRRLVVYRFAHDAVRLLAAAGASACTLTLVRTDHGASLSIEGSVDDDAALDAQALHPTRIALDAYGSELALGHQADRVVLSANMPLPAFEGGGDDAYEDFDAPIDIAEEDAGVDQLEARVASFPDLDDEGVEESAEEEGAEPIRVVKVTLDEVLAADRTIVDDDVAS
jgi:signal transduction histidine kinase